MEVFESTDLGKGTGRYEEQKDDLPSLGNIKSPCISTAFVQLLTSKNMPTRSKMLDNAWSEWMEAD